MSSVRASMERTFGAIVRATSGRLSESSASVPSPLEAVGIGRSRSRSIILSLGLVALIGGTDYLTGHEILFSSFYLLAVALAAWTVGSAFAAFISVLSVGVWLIGDKAAGAVYSHPYVPVWNAVIILLFYLVVARLIAILHRMHSGLEEGVRQRTLQLTREMSERQRLESEILEVGERERRRIGHDLHDSLGQHLTGTALAGQVLEEKLSARLLDEAQDAARVVTLIEEAIGLTRRLARGLYPVEVENGGLAQGLRELAASTSERLLTRCTFACDVPTLVQDNFAATHLYRIAQEAINNAIRHGHAHEIDVRLEATEEAVRLIVTDDGVGIRSESEHGQGMGLRIMAHRATMMRGRLSVERNSRGGTTILCEVPRE